MSLGAQCLLSRNGAQWPWLAAGCGCVFGLGVVSGCAHATTSSSVCVRFVSPLWRLQWEHMDIDVVVAQLSHSIPRRTAFTAIASE